MHTLRCRGQVSKNTARMETGSLMATIWRQIRETTVRYRYIESCRGWKRKSIQGLYNGVERRSEWERGVSILRDPGAPQAFVALLVTRSKFDVLRKRFGGELEHALG